MLKFSEDKLKAVDEMVSHYPEGKQKSALIPLLHFIQKENGGWLSSEAMDYAADLLNIKPIEVYEVATFYSMYNLQPVGKTIFEVCQTGPCMLRGSDDIVKYIPAWKR
jgi:NADH-quinone oxidoreductase subunit E